MKTRITKDPEVRKNEILDTASALFTSKGYAKTTVNDIINTINIAKGTFYYYFKSKEEVMDAIVERFMDISMQAVQTIAEADLPATDKIRLIIENTSDIESKEDMIDQLHAMDNAEMHLKSLVGTITRLAPVLGKIVRQGIDEGSFDTPYPTEATEIMLISSSFLFDEGIFQWNKEELATRADAFVNIFEKVFGVKPGSFKYIADSIKRDGHG